MSNNTENQCEDTAARFTVSVALAANEIEVLEQLFIQGPTWDGNICSKPLTLKEGYSHDSAHVNRS